MTLAFTAEINSLPIDGFTINGFGITGFRTFTVMPLEAGQFSGVVRLDAGEEDDECCTGVTIPPAKSPVRTPWGSTRWLR